MNDQRRTINNDSHTIKQEGLYYCWMSGMGAGERPDWWHGPWFLQVAHIASGAGKALRVDDRRAVVLLCPLLHDLHVSDSGKFTYKKIGCMPLHTIDERHTLWIKRQMDPEFYDPDFLQEIWVGQIPEPERPPDHWCEQFLIRTGIIR